MRICRAFFLFFTFFILIHSTRAQKISGHVFKESGFAAPHITVRFTDPSNSVITKPDGSFTIVAKKLPDTLYFSAQGYEPYKVAVTEETAKDPKFEVVLLYTRVKALLKADSVVMSEVMAAGEKRTDMIYGYTSGITIRGSSDLRYVARGEYISGKKLNLLDSVPPKTDSIIYSSHMLTAGEVNDFNKWKMWEDFQANEFKTWSEHWQLYPQQRYCVQLQNKDHHAVIGQPVFLINKKTSDTAWSAVTDNTGKAELWAGMNDLNADGEYFIACKGYPSINSPSSFANGINKLELNTPCDVSNTVDIALVVDATGSMGDEIDFLKLELEDALRNTFSQYSNLNLNVGSVFYRDKGDEFLTRHLDFQTDLVKLLNFVKLQKAGGGGDTPESVDEALRVAMDSLSWSDNTRTKILFLVLDAPPHDEAKEEMYRLIKKAAGKGIRIVPVVCSGADKSTEFIMRSIALATNGDYIFLTDNSGVGLPHTKPTTDYFDVEFLNTLLQRVIKQMISVNQCSEQKEMETYKNIPLNIDKIKIYPNPSQGNIIIESKDHLKEIFLTDFTGKILMRLEINDSQSKWNVNIGSYPNGTYLVKYISSDDRWGAEKVVLLH